MNDSVLKLVLEALLMNSAKPLSLEELALVFEEWQRPNRESLLAALKELAKDYENRAIELKELALGFSLQTRVEYSPWISSLHAEKPTKYSRALLETLAIICYQQPVTRADIEDIRGVSVSSGILKTLLEREWVRVAGHRDVPGKPAVYATTKTFLDYFNLTSLNNLPALQTTLNFAPIAEQQNEECREE
ncbi:MAG: SMC-Scp complex subunit ScpB [Tatlockia sp.]|nr:SMC-Scp complex subunit ScpB [Tatlockia sp.]